MSTSGYVITWAVGALVVATVLACVVEGGSLCRSDGRLSGLDMLLVAAVGALWPLELLFSPLFLAAAVLDWWFENDRHQEQVRLFFEWVFCWPVLLYRLWAKRRKERGLSA